MKKLSLAAFAALALATLTARAVNHDTVVLPIATGPFKVA